MGARDPALHRSVPGGQRHPGAAASGACGAVGGATLGDVENAAIWTDRTKVQGDPDLFDSLHHAAAAVGLNTSAMIEAGILGKSVYTIQTAEFAGGQEQTLHFHYLLARNGGLVEVAGGLDEHMQQLSSALAHPDAGRERTRRFVESFVRPRGLDRPVAPIMADEIERVARSRSGRAAHRCGTLPPGVCCWRRSGAAPRGRADGASGVLRLRISGRLKPAAPYIGTSRPGSVGSRASAGFRPRDYLRRIS